MIDISKTSLLSAEDICSKLSVSRSTLDRWRRLTNKPSPFGPNGGFQIRVLAEMRSPEDVENERVGLTPFPDPSLFVGGSPRWDVSDVNKWLNENEHKQYVRGFK